NSALVAARLDRLAPSLIAYADLVGRSEREGWKLLIVEAPEVSTVDTTAFTGFMASAAAHERNLVSTRTRDALAAARSRGVRLGRPPTTPETVSSMILSLRRQHA